jgi:hypothetical protein
MAKVLEVYVRVNNFSAECHLPRMRMDVLFGQYRTIEAVQFSEVTTNLSTCQYLRQNLASVV